jgi:cytidylate kinase
MTTVTISRQFGSGGAYLGKRLAKRLGFKYADHAILHLAAKRLGVQAEDLAGKEETVSGFWDDFFRAFSAGAPDAGYYAPPPREMVGDAEFQEVEARIISGIHSRHSAVIMGRGGFSILAGRPDVLNVFLYAPEEFRVKRAMELYKVRDRKTALSLIAEKDAQRTKFVEAVTGRTWTDARNFHLCLDTAQAGFDLAEETVVKMVKTLSAGVKS